MLKTRSKKKQYFMHFSKVMEERPFYRDADRFFYTSTTISRSS